VDPDAAVLHRSACRTGCVEDAATFIVTGALILIGLFLTRSIWPRRRLTTWGLILLGVAGAGTILIGLSPENVNVLFHLVGALNIPAGNAAMILLGLAIWPPRRGPGIALASFSVLSGVLGFLGLMVGPFLVILTGHGGGLAERIALYPLIIWVIVFGLSFVKRRHALAVPRWETRDKSAGQALVSHPETGKAGWWGQ
jgi:hypothetical membrane protein